MRLFIAEKPSVAKAIAGALGVTGKNDGVINCGQDKVTWCFSHMLELAEPDEYTTDEGDRSPKTGKKLWRVEDLPIIPTQWIIKPKEDAKKQLKIIGALLKEASLIVNAGDSDREGQLLIDEVLAHFHNQRVSNRHSLCQLNIIANIAAKVCAEEKAQRATGGHAAVIHPANKPIAI